MNSQLLERAKTTSLALHAVSEDFASLAKNRLVEAFPKSDFISPFVLDDVRFDLGTVISGTSVVRVSMTGTGDMIQEFRYPFDPQLKGNWVRYSAFTMEELESNPLYLRDIATSQLSVMYGRATCIQSRVKTDGVVWLGTSSGKIGRDGTNIESIGSSMLFEWEAPSSAFTPKNIVETYVQTFKQLVEAQS